MNLTRPQIVITAIGIILVIALLVTDACNHQPKPGEPLRGLNAEETKRFNAGAVVFKRTFTEKDGLGPLFNADSCAECHEEPVVGGVGDEEEEHLGLVKDGNCDTLSELGGPVLQNRSSPLLEAHGILGETAPAGYRTGHRTTPHVLGLGLLEAVPDATLRGLADPNDENHDGISGRLALLPNGLIGRFGRKAGISNLDTFTELAFLEEQGITTFAFRQELLPNGKPLPDGVDPTGEPEIEDIDVDRVATFMRLLAPPAPDSTDGNGRVIFATIGCASCHIPSMTTGKSQFKALDHKTFYPYTDLLLHDIGKDLADVCVGVAAPEEFRTAPLMGLGLQTSFLHDGRAKSILEAIGWHGGEANSARIRFFDKLSKDEQRAMLKFLGGL